MALLTPSSPCLICTLIAFGDKPAGKGIVVTSTAQIAANRRNARRSTGPKSAAGKAASRGNALRHGLTAAAITIFDEEYAEFDRFGAGLRAALAPADDYETMLAERIAAYAWRLNRSARFEAQVIDDEHDRLVQNGSSDQSLGMVFRRTAERMAILSRYEAALERALHRAQIALERRQAQRRGEKVLAPIAVQVAVVEAAAEPAPAPAATPSIAALKSEIAKRSQFAAVTLAAASGRAAHPPLPTAPPPVLGAVPPHLGRL
jgi:hypothetical protein